MAAESQVFQIFEALKAFLREKKLTYRDISQRLALSEASVKRIFSLRDCDLTRLAAICEAAGTSLIELATVAGEVKAKTYTLPPLAAEFFADNMGYFVFFRELSAGKTPAEIAAEAGLDQRSVNRYLKTLEELGLIERLPDGAVRHKFEGYLSLHDANDLSRRFLNAWAPYAVNTVISEKPDAQRRLKCFSTGLLAENRARFERDLDDLIERYRHQGFLDQSLTPSAVEAVGGVVALVPMRVGQGLPIPKI